eukprot:CAMPEP_0182422564 /NCGR_PEP_ID=MMETSP1167-20130531/8293_1 /TAXON_ID=2988 /ORGANISM="Mallomonas Sp, Strain CCMP3275" /LENGTH=547 /DNA_ID=CAMNT_0024600733 /DNA_START=304 /DNA_END=1947 /DNA_ORIENTATION=+
MTVIGVDVENEWEVLWGLRDPLTNELYKGSVDTFIGFKLSHTSDNSLVFTLRSYNNLLEETQTCQDCVAHQTVRRRRLSSVQSAQTTETTETTDWSDITHKDKPHPQIGATDQQVFDVPSTPSEAGEKQTSNQPVRSFYTLYGQNEMWSSLDGYGTSFAVYSSHENELYFTGRLCGASTGCPISTLPPNTYVWRVSGAFDPDKDDLGWEFCGVHGGVMTEVFFEINSDGDCNPLFTNNYRLPRDASSSSYQFLFQRQDHPTSSHLQEFTSLATRSSDESRGTEILPIIKKPTNQSDDDMITSEIYLNMTNFIWSAEWNKTQKSLLSSVLCDVISSSSSNKGDESAVQLKETWLNEQGEVKLLVTLNPNSFGVPGTHEKDVTSNEHTVTLHREELVRQMELYLQTMRQTGMLSMELAGRADRERVPGFESIALIHITMTSSMTSSSDTLTSSSDTLTSSLETRYTAVTHLKQASVTWVSALTCVLVMSALVWTVLWVYRAVRQRDLISQIDSFVNPSLEDRPTTRTPDPLHSVLGPQRSLSDPSISSY